MSSQPFLRHDHRKLQEEVMALQVLHLHFANKDGLTFLLSFSSTSLTHSLALLSSPVSAL